MKKVTALNPVKEWIKLFNSGSTIYQISKRYPDYGYYNIRYWLLKNNINVSKNAKNNKINNKNKLKWITLYNNKKSPTEIAKMFDISIDTVIKFLIKSNIYKSRVIKKLSDEQINEIIKLRKMFYSVQYISIKLGISLHNINKVLIKTNLFIIDRKRSFIGKSENEIKTIKNNVIKEFKCGGILSNISINNNLHIGIIKEIIKENIPEVQYFSINSDNKNRRVQLHKFLDYSFNKKIILYDIKKKEFIINPICNNIKI